MAIAYNSKIATDGLLLCLDAANIKSYPGTGNTWFDISGNGRNANIRSGVEFSNNGFTADTRGEAITVSFPQQSVWTLSLWLTRGRYGI